MKKTFILTFFMMLCSITFGRNNPWEGGINPNDFNSSNSVRVVEADDVAKIGENGYPTLAEALAAANAGDAITFVADITEDVTISKTVTIDGAGKTYTGAMTLKADFTVKNVNFDGKGYNGYAITTRGANYVTIEGCTAKNYGYGFVQLASATVLTTVKDVTVSNMNYGVKVDYSSAVVLENVDITATVAAVINSNYGEKTITIKDSKLNILGTWVRNNTIKTNYLFDGANTVEKWLIDSAIDNFKLAAGAAFTAPKELAVTTVEGNKVVYLLGKKQYQSVDKDAVAQVGNENYTELDYALAAAEDGDTVIVLEDMEEAVAIASLGKNVTFDGNGNKMTAGIVIGSDNNKLDSDEVTIKNFKFENKGVSVKELLNVTIEDNTFENITGDAILVVSDELTSMITVKDNEINTVAGAGINLRCPISATIEGNTVKNTTGNSITLQKNSKLTDHEGAISITNNVMENWAAGKTEGRAIRMALGSAAKTVVVENNAMIKTEAPEEFVKITGYNNNTTISINKNYWNGSSPIEQTTPAKYLADGVSPSNYYASYDATNGLSNLVEVSYVAQVGDVKYATLQDAVKACGAGTSTITLLADCVEDVTVVQAPDTKVTIDGNGKNYTGTITVNGKSAAYETAALTITNVNFDATAIAKDASINLGGSNATRYTSNVTVEGCSFKGEGQAKAAIKNYTGGCKNLVVSNSTAEGLHSLVQVKGVAGLTINEVTVNNCKNGIAVGTSTGVVIKNSNITATGYGVRADGTVETTMTMSGNTIKANLPVVVRETNAAYNLVATGNTFTASNEKGAAVTFTTGDDGTFVAPASDATATITGNVTTFGFEAKVGNVYYTTFDKALAAVDGNTITVISPVVITENNKSYNLTGINVEGDVYPMFRIHNGATVTFEGGNFTNGDYVFTLGEGATDEATSGNLVINGGTYVGETTVANVVKGLLTINGGEFSLSAAYQDNYNFLINCYDATYKNDLANVEIKGGKFHKFNPENNAAEGEGTNFCAEGYEAKHNSSDDTYIVRRKPAGHVAYRADVTDKEDREGIAVLLKEVYAFESLVVKVYNNETLMFTSTRRDIDDENKVMFPVVGANTTANIVLWGKESGSWINKILVEPTELNVPNKIEVWSDGVLVDTYTHESGTVLGTNIEKYHALDCVKKAVAQVGETKYVYLEDAINACTNGETVTIIRDITYTEADVKNAIGGATGFGQYPNPCIISIGGQKGENGAANIPSSVNAVVDLNGHTLTNNADSYFFMIMDNAKVVFTDSSEENSGKVITNADGPAVWVVGTETLVTVKDGYFQTASEGGVMHSTHGGDLVIEGGEFKTTAEKTDLLIMINSKDRQNSKFFISGVATVTIKGGIFHGFNPSLVGDDNGATSIEDIKFVNGCAEGYGPVKIGENLYGVYSVSTLVAKIGTIYYNTFASALAAVQNGETIELLDIEGNENTEIEFEKAIGFTVTGSAPRYALPVVTFQNATVNIKDATILIPELDARQNATINVNNSKVYNSGNDGIVKSYYNGAINIDKTSTVYTMQVTTMGYITVAGTLNATWQTNVYGNGLITLNEGAKFNTAALQLTGKDYSGRDNTDEERVGKPAEIIVNEGANFVVGSVKSSSGADYSYNSSKGINIGTVAGKSAVLTLNGGNVDIYMADGQNVNIGEDGTVEVGASTMKTICRKEGGTVGINNNGTINFSELSAELHTATADLYVTTNVKDYSVKYVDGVYRLVAKNYVAQIGEGESAQKFESLQDAINACGAGTNTITLLDDCGEDVTIVQAPDTEITIDGNDKNYTGTITVNGKSAAYETAALTITNVNFDATAIAKDASINLGGSNATRYTSNVTVEGCSFTGEGQAKAAIKNYTGGCKNLVVSKSTAEGLHSLVQVKGVAGLTIDNVTIKDGKNGIAVGTSTGVVIKNSNITATGYGVRADGTVETTMTMSGNTIKANLPVVVRETNAAYNLVATGNVFTASNEKGAAVTFTTGDDGTFVAPASDATATIEGNVTTFGFEAKVGNVYYTTLAKAFAAANSGDTLTFLCDVAGAGLAISKDITVDMGGFNYTINQAVGSTGTESQGFQLLPAAKNVTIQNGKISVAAGTNVVWMFNDYAEKLTVKNVAIDCKNMVWSKSVYLIVANNQHGTNPCPVFDNVTISNYNAERPHALIENNTQLTAQAGLNVVTDPGYSVKYVGGTYKVVANMVKVLNGDTEVGTYATLAEAIAKASVGNTIQFLANITENVTISKNVTIDGAEFSYTGTMTLNNISVTIQNVSFVKGQVYKHKSTGLNANVIIKDCTFDGDGMDAYAINIAAGTSLSIENVTASNYGYGLLQVPSNIQNVSVKDVEISNVYYGLKIDYANAVSLENVTMSDVNVGIYDSNYGDKSYSIKSSTISSIRIWERPAAKTTTFKFAGVNTVGTLSSSEYAKYVLTDTEATLKAPEGHSVTTSVADHTVIYFVDTYKVVAKNYVAQIGEGESAQKFESLQDAINACGAGTNTITLLDDCGEDVTIKQEEGVNVIIDGAGFAYSGTFTIHGNSRYEGEETLTFKNINFVTDKAGHYFIDSNSTASAERYAHNVTVNNCNFKATGAGVNSAAAMRIRQGYDIAIIGGTFTGLHSALQAYGNTGITVDGVTIEGGKNGIAVGTSTGVVIKKSNITATGYGVRADGTVETTMTMSDNTIKANLPVVVRKTNAAYNLVATGNDFTALNGNNDVTFTTGDDEEEFVAPENTNATATITGDVTTFGFGARIENVYYTTFDNAKTASQQGNTITVISPVVVAEDTAYDLAGLTVVGENVYPIFRVQGDATMTVENANITNEDYVFVLGASDGSSSGNLIIENGSYAGTVTVASVTKGLLTINGGEFRANDSEYGSTYLINCYDANYKDGSAKVAISGGTFYGFNPENNAAEGEGTNFCAAGCSAIETGSDIWTVVPRQSQQLSAGWNWFSSYMSEFDGKDGLTMIQNQLGENGIEVKNHHDGTSRYEAGYGWYGNLKSVNVRSMYMINVAEENPIEIGGAPVTSCTITLKPGWNAIGFPSTESINVADVFAQVQNNDKDYIKSKDQYVGYDGGYWEDGSLQSMEPGKGYMYYNAGTTDQTLVFPIAKSRGEVRANMTTEGNYWVANGASFANNMTMTAVLNVNGVEMTDNYEVAAFAGEEVRGSARPVYVESIDRYVMFMTIYGEGNEELTFKYIDLDTYEVHNLNDMVVYADNAMLGSLRKPIELCYGTMGIGENGFDTMSLYPNPTRTGRTISLEAICDMVEVFNSLGVKVAEYRNVETIDGIEEAGVYVIRVTNDSTVQNCRLIVK